MALVEGMYDPPSFSSSLLQLPVGLSLGREDSSIDDTNNSPESEDDDQSSCFKCLLLNAARIECRE